MTRRSFLRGAAMAGGLFVVPCSAWAEKDGGAGRSKEASANDRLNIAGVGLGVRGLGNLEKCEGHKIVALCDVDGTQGGEAFKRYPDAVRFKDFRKMLDKGKEIDAVIISTPDHSHAVIAAAAMKRGKHVFMETPLAHDVWECRKLAELAAEKGVATQMGNERHSGPGIRNAVEMLWGGGLGPVREVHCWTNRPQWPQGIGRPKGKERVSDQLDWDLWLGPSQERSFDRAYHPYRWRGWIDFGTGALGAMGCHLLDVVYWGLHLGEAESYSVQAETSGCNGETYPTASTIRYEFPDRGDLPPVTITWYDGGRQPETPEGLPYLRELGSNGTLFVGDEHSMLFGPTAFGTNPGQVGPRTIPEFLKLEDKKPFDKIPRVKEGDWKKGNRHMMEWIDAARSGKSPCANFEYSAGLTEMVLLGNAAVIAGEPLEWQVQEGKLKGSQKANDLIHRKYRKGWRLL